MKEEEYHCCVCGHKLSSHIDEGKYWRCHAIGPDGYQCECRLLKDVAENDILFYALELRIEEAVQEFIKTAEEMGITEEEVDMEINNARKETLKKLFKSEEEEG